MAKSCSLLLLGDFTGPLLYQGGVSPTPETHSSCPTRIRFQRFSVGGCGVHKGKVGGVPGLVRGGAGRGARYSSGTLGGD